MARLLPAALALSSLCVSCAGAPGAARAPFVPTTEASATFSRVFSCPTDRIEVTPSDPPAPPEIAADPGRLAVWKDTHSAEFHYAVTGCGHQAAFACRVYRMRSGPTASCLPDISQDLARLEPSEPAGQEESARRLAESKRQLAESNRQLAELLAIDEELKVLGRTLPPGKHLIGMAFTPLPGRGLMVSQVLTGGPGAGKLQPGDVITAAEGSPVASFPELWPTWKAHMGGSLRLQVGRDGVVREVVLSLRP